MRILEEHEQKWGCSEEDCENTAVLEVGEGLYYESMTAFLCLECLLKAVKLAERG